MQKFKNNRICKLLNIQYPIIQGGMVWCSGYKLASAVSNAGGIGLIGAGSMDAEILDNHITKCKQSTDKPFGVNIPLIHRNAADLIEVVLRQEVEIVFTSAGNPAKWTQVLKSSGIKVVHVVANSKFAMKASDAGVDAIVAEGFEAGGHNGREETTTFTLIPLLRDSIHVPIIAAGGMFDGSSMLAAFALGAEGIQVGSRFAVCYESSAHEKFKNYVINAVEGDTKLLMKRMVPVRLLMNEFADSMHEKEWNGASIQELSEFLGSGRCKKGVFEGDLVEGELEIGQISAKINKIESAQDIITDITNGYFKGLKGLCQ
jgi:enoyl-[acyl-carrier protein] reductase II